MSDLIEREQALKALRGAEAITRAFGYHNVYEAIRRVPSAEPKKGKWIKTGNKMEKEPRKIWWFQCSECGFRLTSPTDRTVYNYCPCCGTNMEATE